MFVLFDSPSAIRTDFNFGAAVGGRQEVLHQLRIDRVKAQRSYHLVQRQTTIEACPCK